MEFTQKELELIKKVTNVYAIIHSDYMGSDEDNETAEAIWEKLDEAGIDDEEKELEYEDTLEANLYEENEDECDAKVTLCHIGGYELLRDGTQYEYAETLEELQDVLESYEVEFDTDIEDLDELVDSVEEAWGERFNDGGGSGWFE